MANHKEARIQKSDGAMTDGGEADKPEDLLKLIMTADELPQSSQNKMMFPAPSKEPGEV